MKERVKFALVATMLMTLAGLSWLLPLRYVVEGGSVIELALSLVVCLIINSFSAVYIRHERRNAIEGYPLMDERSRAVRAQTGNYAFFISAAFVLFLFAFSLTGSAILGHLDIHADEVLFMTMIIMVSVYLGVWTLLTFKWRLD